MSDKTNTTSEITSAYDDGYVVGKREGRRQGLEEAAKAVAGIKQVREPYILRNMGDRPKSDADGWRDLTSQEKKAYESANAYILRLIDGVSPPECTHPHLDMAPDSCCAICGKTRAEIDSTSRLSDIQPQVVLDIVRQTLIYQTQTLRLQKAPMRILVILAKSYPAVMTWEAVAEQLWGQHPPTEPLNTIRVHVARTRVRMREANIPDILHGFREYNVYQLELRAPLIIYTNHIQSR